MFRYNGARNTQQESWRNSNEQRVIKISLSFHFDNQVNGSTHTHTHAHIYIYKYIDSHLDYNNFPHCLCMCVRMYVCMYVCCVLVCCVCMCLCVVCVLGEQENKDGKRSIKRSRFHLIDLAGSERQKNTSATG